MAFKLIFFLTSSPHHPMLNPQPLGQGPHPHNRHSAYTITDRDRDSSFGFFTRTSRCDAFPNSSSVSSNSFTVSPSTATPVADSPDNASTGLSGAAVFSTALIGVFVAGYLFEIS
ncbi:unnamed protein product [Rhodiola kirilowii]